MTMKDEREALSAVAEVLTRLRRVPGSSHVELTLHNGVVLRCKPIPPLYLQALNERFQHPEPPKAFIEAKGREEENPSDPAYLRACADVDRQHAVAVTNLMFGMGTEVVSVPEGIHPPESEGWIKELARAQKFTGVEVPIDLSDADMRYISWLRFYALDNDNDASMAGILPQQIAGLQEGEIAAAIEAFRRLRRGGADPEGALPEAGTNGNRANRANRRAAERVR